MFEQAYVKFLETMKKYDLVSEDTKKVVIATSGGKDANIMTELLYRYQQEERPDLVLELANAAIPKWKYMPDEYIDRLDDEDKKKALREEQTYIDKHRLYWEAKGIKTVYLQHYGTSNDEEIFQSSIPCTHCFVAQKKALFHYLEEMEDAESTRLAVGLTKWDMLYLALSHILRANGKTWKEIKEQDIERYKMDCMHFATFSPIPKLNIGIPGKKVYTIEPIIALSDLETREYAKDLDLPVIPDVCVSLFGSKFCSDKRYFDNFMKVSAIEEVNLSKNNTNSLLTSELDPLYSNYEDILSLLEKTQLLPPVEDFDGILYETYMDEVMKAGVTD